MRTHSRVYTFRTRETQTGPGALSTPGTAVFTGRRAVRGRRLPPLSGRSLPPRRRNPARDVKVTRHQQGFPGSRPSGLSPRLWPPWLGQRPLGLFRELRTQPARNRPRTSRRGQVEHKPVATSLASARPPQLAHSPRATSCRNCRPSPCAGLSPARSTTAAPPRPARSAVGAPIPASRTGCPPPGTSPGGSRVHCRSLGGGGARLCPSGLATSTPQTFPVAYRRAVTIARRKFPPRRDRRDAPHPAQIRQVRAGGV